jgi:hypothetical protein
LKSETDLIGGIARTSSFLDYNRRIFLRTELDTLFAICNLAESKAYKESFILLRTVFEKFLFFWLMLEGNKYHWTKRYNIQPEESHTPREARDTTIQHWRKEKKKGNPNFQDILTFDAAADNVIIVTGESDGLYEKSDSNKTGLVIPIYSFILEHYKPSLAHTSIEIPEGMVPKDILKEQIEEQKMIYHQYLHIENIFRNLIRNNLITTNQLDKIKVHYSFLSEYVHPGLASLDIWRNINPYDMSPSREYPEQILKELIFLYIAKLMQLYIAVFVKKYRRNNANVDPRVLKYETIIKKLVELTKEFWFFDNEPTTYDIQHSDSVKQFHRHKQLREISDKIVYYDNPAERLRNLRAFYP